MADFSGRRSDMVAPTQATCAAYEEAEEKFRQQWQESLGDPARRQQLRDQIDALSEMPLGDALQEFTGVDLAEHREHLNALPEQLQKDLVSSTVDALENGLDLRVSLAYSTDGSLGAEITKWYSGADQPALVDLRVITP
jgi:hypothetical protein